MIFLALALQAFTLRGTILTEFSSVLEDLAMREH